MKKEKLYQEVNSCQIEDSLIRAFSQIGDNLGDLLYEKETVTLNNRLYNNSEIKIYNDFLVEELDVILSGSYKQLLTKIKSCLRRAS